MKKRLILNDRSNFKTIREAGAVYIDKTKQIYDCIGETGYYFLARPRRFGKSMLCATLREMFLGSKDLFKGLWLETSDWAWKKHPVIHLNMAGAAGAGKTVAQIEEALIYQLKNIALDYEIEIAKTTQASVIFSEMIIDLARKYGEKTVVIIDEYDKPLLDSVLSNQGDYTPALGLLKSFYGRLKEMEDHLRFVFITGVFKFAKTSIFSDLNNLQDITLEPKAATIVGYTQEELEADFGPEIEALMKKSSLSRTDLLMQLKENYNGYIFGYDQTTEKLTPTVYNSFAINDVFSKNSLIENGWFSTGTPSLLINKLEKENFAQINIEQLKIDSSKLINSCEPGDLTAEALLYYAGYLTIKSYIKPPISDIVLHLPNKEVANAMAKEILPRMTKKSLNLSKRAALDVRYAWELDDFEAVKNCLNICLAMIHNELYTTSESYFQTLIMMFLHMADIRVEPEVPSRNGYADLVLWLNNKIYVIELKMNQSVNSAMKQIHEKEYYKSLLAEKKPIVLVGIKCSSENRAIVDLKAEILET